LCLSYIRTRKTKGTGAVKFWLLIEVWWLEMQIEAIQERSRRETRIQSLLQAAIQFIFIRKNEQRHYRCGTPITKIEGNHQLQRGN
jgi:hypothetical protein